METFCHVGQYNIKTKERGTPASNQCNEGKKKIWSKAGLDNCYREKKGSSRLKASRKRNRRPFAGEKTLAKKQRRGTADTRKLPHNLTEI